MSQKVMDRRLQMQSAPSSFFSEELRFPSERQVGFWKAEHAAEYCGTDGMMLTSGSKPVSSSPLEKLHPVGGSLVEHLKSPQAYAFVEQKAETTLENHLMGANSNLTNLKDHNHNFGSRSSRYVQPASEFEEGNRVNLNGFHFENSLFSSSFSEVFNKKISFSSNDVHFGQSAYASSFNLEHDEPESLEEMEAQTIGNLLPDSVDDLLSGIIDDEDYLAQPNNGDEVEDDLFYSGGGLELEGEDYLTSIKPSQFVDSGVPNCHAGGLSSQAGGEHPSGEHPSRTLFVRNINSNVDDDELKNLFEQYGDIRTLYTVCKHRGFVMISYYDIRAAKNAMKALQHKPLRRKKLDIHYSIPKDNPSEKDIDQGTLVVFNLDSSVSNDELRQIFGAYGEVKEIHETPNKNHHKFIEFYDVRSAEAALNSLNKCDIAGKRIKLEASHPGGERWCSTQQLSTELDEDEFSGYKLASPLSNSPPECFGSITSGGKAITGLDNIAIQSFNSISRDPVSPLIESPFHGLSSSVPRRLSSPKRVATVHNHGNTSVPGHLCHSIGHTNFGYQCTADYHPHSLPDKHNRSISGIPLNSPSTMSAMDIINSRPANRIENLGHRVGSGSFNSHSLEHHEAGFGALGNGSCPVHGHQYFWNNSDSYHHHPPGAMLWKNSSSVLNNVPSHAPPQMHGFPRVPSHISNTIQTLHHHHVGSAPAMNPMFWDRRQAYTGDPMEASAFLQAPLGSMGFSGNSRQHLLDLDSHNIFPHAGGSCMDNSISSAHVGIPSPQQRYPVFHGRNMIPGSYDAPSDRVRIRRSDASSNQADNRNQYELDIDRIMRGEDSRTTLMIKNIPNKYTSKMLLATIDEHHRGTYDFFYLPIDFKNKCNVGYAFINMVDPQHIISFYQAFNGKKWEKFNSEKVASLAYARIQGRPALIVHFQNSSLMNEDKRCRPILFHADGPNAGDQEPFPTGVNIRSRPGRSRTTGNDEVHQGSPSTSMNGEDSSNHTDSSGSTRGE